MLGPESRPKQDRLGTPQWPLGAFAQGRGGVGWAAYDRTVHRQRHRDPDRDPPDPGQRRLSGVRRAESLGIYPGSNRPQSRGL